MLDYRRLLFFGCSSNQTHRHRALLSSLRSSVLITCDNTAAFLTFIAMKQQLLVKTTILPLAELNTIVTLVCDKIDWDNHNSPLGRFRCVCSQSCKNGSKHPMLSISMAYNVISCKQIERNTQKIKIADFTNF